MSSARTATGSERSVARLHGRRRRLDALPVSSGNAADGASRLGCSIDCGTRLRGLRRSISTLRDGFRPPGPPNQAVGGDPDDRACWYLPHLGRGSQVRYLVRELPSASYVHTSVDGTDAGVAQLVERRPSKPHVAGSSPVSRSNSLSRQIAEQRPHRLTLAERPTATANAAIGDVLPTGQRSIRRLLEHHDVPTGEERPRMRPFGRRLARVDVPDDA